MLTPHQIDARARVVRNEVATKMAAMKGTLKEYRVFVACSLTGEYTEAHATKLYQKHGGEYCEAVSANSRLRWREAEFVG